MAINTHDQRLWRSLSELGEAAAAASPAPVNSEPAGGRVASSWQPVWPGSVDRRQFLRLVEAALASAGVAGCTLQPPESIRPYTVAPPHDVAPSRPLYYATTMTIGGYGLGLLGTTHQGRPTKLDGGPEHPASRGKSLPFMQAAILSLYDPDRSRAVVRQQGKARTASVHSWSDLSIALNEALAKAKATGAGIRVLTQTVTSPTLSRQLRSFVAAYPTARWVRYEPLHDDAALAAAQTLYGQPVHLLPHLAAAKRIVSLGYDFLSDPRDGLRLADAYMQARQPAPGATAETVCRLYAAETTPTLTGAVADHRLALRPSRMPRLAGALTRLIAGLEPAAGSCTPAELAWVRAAAADLTAHRGASIVLVGREQGSEVHQMAYLANELLGAPGRTLTFLEPVESHSEPSRTALATLVDDMQAGRVDVLIVLGGNPAYASPAALPFANAIGRVATSVHLSCYEDETSALCTWHAPCSHELEAWGDARSYDGTASLIQPLIRPLFDTRSHLELMAMLTPGAAGNTSGFDLVYNYWHAWHQQHGGGEAFQTFWQRSLQRGVIDGTQAKTHTAASLLANKPSLLTVPPGAWEAAEEVELFLVPDPTVWDGSFANNAWLQELPKPYLTLTWENAVLIAPALAHRLALKTGDLVELVGKGAAGREAPVKGPILVLPGQADGAVTVSFGYGRTAGGQVAKGRGINAFQLLSPTEVGPGGVQLRRTPDKARLALTQTQHTMEDREPARSLLLQELSDAPEQVRKELRQEDPAPDQTLYRQPAQAEHAWAMAIDLNRCIGCGACTVACQAENNIPVVGKEQILKGRDMQWIRVDRYFSGPAVDPRVRFQPVPCMHCENAPCELVCPVEATVHDSEGLNQMVYNRCVGTRYCSNNCPYKVRRFNFLTYNDPRVETMKLLRNPDVSVRERGVMEKCTYCVQRISAARIQSEIDGKPLRDGDVVTACAAACPTSAIIFGDLRQPQAKVSQARNDPRHYTLLAELNTRPRTTYLAQVRNPNPALTTREP